MKPWSAAMHSISHFCVAFVRSEEGQMAPFAFSGLLIAYSLFMGAAIDMSNLWLHQYRASTAAQAACESGAADLMWVTNQGTAAAVTHYEAAATGFPLAVSTGSGTYAAPPPNTSLSGNCGSAGASVAMCAYAKANGYDSTTSGVNVSWTVSNITPTQKTYNPNGYGGMPRFTPPSSLPATPPVTNNGVLPYMQVTVTEAVPTYLLSVMPWFKSPVNVSGQCNCGLSSSSTSHDATLANNAWCFGTSPSSPASCITTPVQPGEFLGWAQPAVESGLVPDSINAPVPPSGTQADISLNCAGACASPTWSFPDTPISPTTTITVYLIGNELSGGFVGDGAAGGQGAWANITATAGTITHNPASLITFHGSYSTTYFEFNCPYSTQTTSVYLCNSGGDSQYDGYPASGVPAADIGLESAVTGKNARTDPTYGGQSDVGVDWATVTGITNLNQIQISLSATTNNEFDGYVWARWGGSSGLSVATF